MKHLMLGFFFCGLWAFPYHQASSSNTLYLRGFVPKVQRLQIERTTNGLEMFFKQNSTNFQTSLTLQVQRKGLELETQKLTSNFHSLHYQDQENHPIQTVTLIQN